MGKARYLPIRRVGPGRPVMITLPYKRRPPYRHEGEKGVTKRCFVLQTWVPNPAHPRKFGVLEGIMRDIVNNGVINNPKGHRILTTSFHHTSRKTLIDIATTIAQMFGLNKETITTDDGSKLDIWR